MTVKIIHETYFEQVVNFPSFYCAKVLILIPVKYEYCHAGGHYS